MMLGKRQDVPGFAADMNCLSDADLNVKKENMCWWWGWILNSALS